MHRWISVCCAAICSASFAFAEMALPREPIDLPEAGPVEADGPLKPILMLEIRGLENAVQGIFRIAQVHAPLFSVEDIRSLVYSQLGSPEGIGLDTHRAAWAYLFLPEDDQPQVLLSLPVTDGGAPYLALLDETLPADTSREWPDGVHAYLSGPSGMFPFQAMARGNQVLLLQTLPDAGLGLDFDGVTALLDTLPSVLPLEGDVILGVPELSFLKRLIPEEQFTRTMWDVEAIHVGIAVLPHKILFMSRQDYSPLAPMTRLLEQPVPPSPATTMVAAPDALGVSVTSMEAYSIMDELAESIRAEFLEGAQQILAGMEPQPDIREEKLSAIYDGAVDFLKNFGPNVGIAFLPPTTEYPIRALAYQEVLNMPDIRDLAKTLEDKVKDEVEAEAGRTTTAADIHIPGGHDIRISADGTEIHIPGGRDIRIPDTHSPGIHVPGGHVLADTTTANWTDFFDATTRSFEGIDVTRISSTWIDEFMDFDFFAQNALEVAWLTDGILVSSAEEEAMDWLIETSLGAPTPPLYQDPNFSALFPDVREEAVTLAYIHLFDLLRAYQPLLGSFAPDFFPQLTMPEGRGTIAMYSRVDKNALLSQMAITYDDYRRLVDLIESVYLSLASPTMVDTVDIDVYDENEYSTLDEDKDDEETDAPADSGDTE